MEAFSCTKPHSSEKSLHNCETFSQTTRAFCASPHFPQQAFHLPTHSDRIFLSPLFSRKHATFLGRRRASRIEHEKEPDRRASTNRNSCQRFSVTNVGRLFARRRRHELLASDPGRLATALDDRPDMPACFITLRSHGLAYAKSNISQCLNEDLIPRRPRILRRQNVPAVHRLPRGDRHE